MGQPDLVVAGWRIVRITHDRLDRKPQTVASQLRRLLRA
jgi:signal transduction protein with GAF and PtsI domain